MIQELLNNAKEISAVREQIIELYKKAWFARLQATTAYEKAKIEREDSIRSTQLFDEKECWDEVVYRLGDLAGALLNAQCFAEQRAREAEQK